MSAQNRARHSKISMTPHQKWENYRFQLHIYPPILYTVAEVDPPEPAGKSSTLGTSQIWEWSHWMWGEMRGVPVGTGYSTAGYKLLLSTLILQIQKSQHQSFNIWIADDVTSKQFGREEYRNQPIHVDLAHMREEELQIVDMSPFH